MEFESTVLTEISVHGTFSSDIEYQNLPIDLIVGLDVETIEIYSQIPGLGFQIYTTKNPSFLRLGKQLRHSSFSLDTFDVVFAATESSDVSCCQM